MADAQKKPADWIPLGQGKGSAAAKDCSDAQLETFVSWFEGAKSDPAVAKREPAYWAAKSEQAKRVTQPADETPQPPAVQERAKPVTRAAPPAQAPAAAQTTDLARLSTEAQIRLLEAHNPSAITAKLARLAEEFHLVAPATEVAMLPVGFGVQYDYVHINPDPSKDGPGEVYKQGDKLALTKAPIEKIGRAAGINWDPILTRRLDNGRDALYCHFKAVGYGKDFGGQEFTVTGEVEIDLRDGSPTVLAMKGRAERSEAYWAKKDNRAKRPIDIAEELENARLWVLRNAETKAKLRAIVSQGVKRSYSKSELSKPFAIAKLIWTGWAEDPGLREKLAIMTAERALGGGARLYGAPPKALSAHHAPPPVGTGTVDGEIVDEVLAQGEFEDDEDDVDFPGEG